MEQRLFYLLNRAQHRIYKHADQVCQQALGVSVTQLGALLLLAQQPGCLLKDLASNLDLNNSALTGLAGRMEENGLIQRQPCEQDGRASRLYLTPLGQTKIEQARPLITQLNSALTQDFTAEEIQVILRFLNHQLQRF